MGTDPVMVRRRCVLVDVDGTLADNSHRQQYVRHKPKNWAAFNAGIHKDTLHEHVATVVKALDAQGFAILIVTARTDDLREKTMIWLRDVAGLEGIYQKMYMRKYKDHRADDIIKMELLDQILMDGYDPYLVLDDRNRVVEMWRNRGIPCFQVAPGDF